MAKEKPIAILLNPSSGGGKAQKKRQQLQRSLHSLSILHEIIESQSEKHFRQLVSDLVEEHSAIVVAGGDSSLFIVIDELMKKGLKVPLGLIPLGSCNDLARELSLTQFRHACLALQRKNKRVIDIGMIDVDGKPIAYFPGQVSFGLGVEVNRLVEEKKARSSLLARMPILAGIEALKRSLQSPSLPISLLVEGEEETFSGELLLGVISNIRFYASGLKIAPQARLDDGCLDAILLPQTSFFQIARLGINAAIGRKNSNPIRYLRSARFRVRATKPLYLQVDGNIILQDDKPVSLTDFRVNVIPAAAEIFA